MTISSALMSVSIIDELYSITKDGRTKLVLTANTTLDRKSFIDKLKALIQDKDKQIQIISLQKENENLKEKLLALNGQIQTAQAPNQATFDNKPNKELFDARDRVLTEINANENSIKKVFEKGELLSQAMKATSDFEDAKKDIDTNVFEYIKNNIKITLGEQKLVDNGNGTYNLLIPIIWNVDNSQLEKIFEKYFQLSSNYNKGNSLITINNFDNKGNKQKSPYTNNIYQYLINKEVLIKVTVGNYSNKITLAVGRECSSLFTCLGNRGIDQYQLKYSIAGHLEGTLDSYKNDKNPLIIKNIPRGALGNLTTISVLTEIINHQQ